MAVTVLRDLLSVLWRERDLLELLGNLYLCETRATAAGRDSAEAYRRRVESVLGALSAAELERAIVTRELAGELGTDDYPSLTRLIELCPANWASILSEHRQALRTMATRAQDEAATGSLLRLAPRPDQATADVVVGGGADDRPVVQRSLLDFLG